MLLIIFYVGADPARADQSELLMVHVFPELEESSNIIFNPPSKKTLKRFRNVNAYPARLGKYHWAHAILKDQISRNVREVAINALRSVHIPLTRSSHDKAGLDVYMERQLALLKQPHQKKKYTYNQIRRELIRGLLENRSWEGK